MAKRRLHRRKKHHRDTNNNEEALTDEIAGEAVERNHEGKMHNPADEDDLENVTDKKIEGEAPGDSTGIKGRPGDNLEQIPTKPADYAHSRSHAG